MLPAWLGPRVFDMVFKASAENDKYARLLQSSAGVAVFVSERDDKDHWARAGRACQRLTIRPTPAEGCLRSLQFTDDTRGVSE
jgi:hypothetical protein